MPLKRLVSVRASLFVAGLVLAVPAFVCGASASGQVHADGAQPSSAPPAAQPVSGAPHRGLVVHGQWKIVVKNADGTIASTTEFENSLSDSGFSAEHLMLGSIVPGTWGVGLSNLTATQSPCGTSYCLVVPSKSSGQGFNLCASVQANTNSSTCYSGLSYTISGTTNTATNTFQLTGNFAATQAGTITGVQTYLLYCATDPNVNTPATASTVSPSTCAATVGDASGLQQFTSASSTTTPAFTAVAVTSGQAVQVTVVISFS